MSENLLVVFMPVEEMSKYLSKSPESLVRSLIKGRTEELFMVEVDSIQHIFPQIWFAIKDNYSMFQHLVDSDNMTVDIEFTVQTDQIYPRAHLALGFQIPNSEERLMMIHHVNPSEKTELNQLCQLLLQPSWPLLIINREATHFLNLRNIKNTLLELSDLPEQIAILQQWGKQEGGA